MNYCALTGVTRIPFETFDATFPRVSVPKNSSVPSDIDQPINSFRFNSFRTLCALFCTSRQLLSFQSFAHPLGKTPGCGTVCTFSFR